MSAERPRMLAVVRRFNWNHVDYVAALDRHFDLLVGYAGERAEGSVDHAAREGRRVVAVDERDGLARAIAGFEPDLVHVMYHRHEEQALLARELAGEDVRVLFECRDPLTMLDRATPGDPDFRLEREALEAGDRHVLVSHALRDYYERSHGLDLRDALIAPQSYPAWTIGPPRPKLSAADGRTHIAVVGSAADQPGSGRWCGGIIRSLVSQGLVVHSHFHDLEELGVSLQPYVELAEELDDYHLHPAIPYRDGHRLSDAISRYDLMGVFYEHDAPRHNLSAILAVSLPARAVCGWLYGGIPVVCFPHYRGVVERIEQHGIGFVVEELGDLAAVAADRPAIEAATERCLACRHQFTTEWAAERVEELVA